MKHPGGTDTRMVAAHVLDAVLHRGRSLRAELAAALPKLPDPRDRALVEAICFAALRNRARHDAALKAWMQRPLPQRDRPLRALLHAGFAQLDPLGLPPHAAVAETVEAAEGQYSAAIRGGHSAFNMKSRMQFEAVALAVAEADGGVTVLVSDDGTREDHFRSLGTCATGGDSF